MKKISNKFLKIGTNPWRYILNYQKDFGTFEIAEIFEIDHANNNICQDGVILASYLSRTTMMQNIDCWIGFGFFAKNRDKLVKTVPISTFDELMEVSKMHVLLDSKDEKINWYRDTIIIKLLHMSDEKWLEKFPCDLRHRAITSEDIKQEIGQYEKMIFNDKKYLEIISKIWGNNNE